MAIAALLWANVETMSYEHPRGTIVSIQVGGVGPSHTLRFWIDSGLKTLFFSVVGLEDRRQFDIGELPCRASQLPAAITGWG